MKRIFLATLMFAALGGCAEPANESRESAAEPYPEGVHPASDPRAVAAIAELPPVEIDPSLPDWAQAMLQASVTGVPGWGVAWTPAPRLDEIPGWTPRGLVNGVPFEARTLLFVRTPDDRGWQFQLTDIAYDPLDPATRVAGASPQTVHVTLGDEPSPGFSRVHGLQFGGAMFQVRRRPEQDATTSWNTSFSLALEITDWRRRPWDAAGGFQLGGSASGRIYVNFQASETGADDDLKNSFVAGVFNDVPIVYYGPPDD